MKKVVVLSAVAAAVMMAGAANAAEIYNKDGNKLDLYGKTACIIFPVIIVRMAINLISVWVLKARLKLPIN